ncbi:small glutamine-rich tetratricopeptide repeat-containing protein alpha isoform X2 [Fukomys damarensis]|uniref:small glutamine-rich tetratricopeptide repeat-containing protein alpha isoform X2 n=1 Tax=Fukomys damarensis TaxID=885580 RepID=UPI00053FAC09|nr:small glutamine-rich tetratricopeptide repeat-containing protein alpha isoform X2 [Fukomys damarensis]XP_010633140.1 small glutamine-rich tetratricopeptide repeat-containing protein alpha isoform X2 [Fukomys damarensis]
MDNKKRLAYAIIQFLHDQLRHGGLSSDAQESLEVAIQCLETAFGVTVEDGDLALPQTLPEIFEAAASAKEALKDLRNPERTPPSEEDSAEAERLKTEGNEQMKMENFEAAVHLYGKAIELNPTNAVYFCNRAAAYSKLGDYAGAVRDCERAICLDPAYSKAYGRMGLALSSLNKHAEAVAYYKKALELDPDNETYKSNLKIAELKLRETPSPGQPGLQVWTSERRNREARPPTGHETSSVSGIDIAGLLNNPSFINMASSLMNSPQLQQLMSGMISGSHNPLGTPGTSPSQNDLSGLIQAGQQFAQHMQMQNPEFIEQLRSQMRSRTPSASNEEPQE